jgi:hypothetical protein
MLGKAPSAAGGGPRVIVRGLDRLSGLARAGPTRSHGVTPLVGASAQARWSKASDLGAGHGRAVVFAVGQMNVQTVLATAYRSGGEPVHFHLHFAFDPSLPWSTQVGFASSAGPLVLPRRHP